MRRFLSARTKGILGLGQLDGVRIVCETRVWLVLWLCQAHGAFEVRNFLSISRIQVSYYRIRLF